MTLYKVLNEDGSAFHGGTGGWHLPTGKRPGKWMPAVPVDPCQSGYHLCDGTADLMHWLGPTIWIAEGRGEAQRSENKIVYAEARLVTRCDHWNERTARLFAAACARDVLHLYESYFPNDPRVRRCIEAAERFAKEEIDQKVLAAASAAASVAVSAAASVAARAAARAKQSNRLAHLLRYGTVIQEAR
jgi:hypothetical protein